MDLNSITVSSDAGGTLWLALSEVDLNAPAWNVNLGGTTDGEIEFFLYVNAANTYWGDLTGLPGTAGGVLGDFTNDFAFSQSFKADGLDSGPYSAVLMAKIVYEGFGQTSFDVAASAVPEPTTMLLFGTGLAALAGILARRKERNKRT